MLLPPKADPRWRTVVTSTTDYPVKNLSVQLAISRVRFMTWDRQEPTIARAIDTLHEFFTKNATQTKEDLRVIFGSKP